MKIQKRILAICVLLALPTMLPAQWALYGDLGWPQALIATPDGGCVIATTGNIFRLSPSGGVVWGQRFDSGPPYFYCKLVWPTPDGGCIAASDESSGGTATLFKLSAAGSVVWEKTYRCTNAQASVFCPAPDGGALLAGYLDGKLILCRWTAEGEIAWQKACDSGRSETASAAVPTSDGGFLVLSSSWSTDLGAPGGSDLWVLKFDATGEIEWQKLIGGAADDVGESVRQTADGGYLIAGRTASFETDGLARFWLMKLSSTGAVERQLTLDHVWGGDRWLSLRPAADGSFIAALRPGSLATPGRVVLVAISANGAIIRETPYPSAFDNLESVAMTPTEDGGCLVSLTGYYSYLGSNDTDSHVLKLAPSGEIEWQRVYGSQYSPDGVFLVSRAGDGGCLLAGTTGSWSNLQNALWVMKTAPDGSIGPSCYFIRSADVRPVDEPGTSKEVGATVTDTAAVPQNAGFVEEPASINFNPWGSGAALLALGNPSSTLTMSVPADTGTTTPEPGSHVYATGTLVQIRATPQADYAFQNWAGNITSGHNSISILLDGDKTVIAAFYWTGHDIIDEYVEKYCFIATAAYGDPSHPDVEVLRQFRDRYLKKSRLGRSLVDLYYKYSPRAARIVERDPVLRAFSRILLYPAVAVSRALVKSGTPY